MYQEKRPTCVTVIGWSETKTLSGMLWNNEKRRTIAFNLTPKAELFFPFV